MALREAEKHFFQPLAGNHVSGRSYHKKTVLSTVFAAKSLDLAQIGRIEHLGPIIKKLFLSPVTDGEKILKITQNSLFRELCGTLNPLDLVVVAPKKLVSNLLTQAHELVPRIKAWNREIRPILTMKPRPRTIVATYGLLFKPMDQAKERRTSPLSRHAHPALDFDDIATESTWTDSKGRSSDFLVKNKEPIRDDRGRDPHGVRISLLADGRAACIGWIRRDR